LSIAADAALRPYAAAARPRREARNLAWLIDGNADDRAVIGAAIAEVPAEGNEDLALKQRQRAALILYFIETPADRGCDIDRPAGLDRAIGEGKRENLVTRPIGRMTAASR
jgi:hypothetical protein